MDLQIKREVSDFLNKCAEIKNCKFIMAPTKIKDLLKSIVNSAELHQLFSTVTRNFDYVAAKRACFIMSQDGFSGRGYLSLPNTAGDRLAFIFCLFVEFDRESMNFNDFLRTYFYEDGSYYASYCSFCSSVVASLENIMCEIYAAELAQPDPIPVPEIPADGERGRRLSAISLSIAREKQFLFESALPEEDRESGLNLLTELEKAVKEDNLSLIEALVCGYNYYILYHNVVSEQVTDLISLIAGGEVVS